MTAVGSLGVRSSGSYDSLQQQQQLYRKPPKMLFKEKDGLFPWIRKFTSRKKVGMLLLCVVSLSVFLWVLFVDRGEDAQELNASISNGVLPPEAGQKDNFRNIDSKEQTNVGQRASNVQLHPSPPPPPVYFKGYTLPPGNPCEGFTLLPPPADKKKTGPRPCPVCYLAIEQAIALMPDAPSFSPGICNLTYIHEENSRKTEFGGSEFGGYPSLMQRNGSYDVRDSISVHCGYDIIPIGQFFYNSKLHGFTHYPLFVILPFGFVYNMMDSVAHYCTFAISLTFVSIVFCFAAHPCDRFATGIRPGHQTRFDIDDPDLLEMESCRGVVVASAIFGAFDLIRQPRNISEYAKKTVCFYMFVDEETEVFLRNSSKLDSSMIIGLLMQLKLINTIFLQIP